MARASGLTVLSKIAKLVGLIALTGVLAAGVVLPYVGGAGLAAKAGADKFLNTSCSLTEEPVQQKTTILASDGKTVIATLFDQNRSVVSLNLVPKSVTEALIGTEDRRFYQHHGVDLRGLVRAALHTSSGSTQGGSTLTEQYVKQVNYYDAISAGDQAKAQAAIDQNIDRKLSDAQCALELEKKYTKNQILEKYLNIAFFGENAYGIQTAAQTYFGIPASKLSIPQAALLVGLVQSPSYYDPFVNPDAARARRDVVLDNMVTSNYITQAQADAYKQTPIALTKSNPAPARGCANSGAVSPIKNVGFFCDYVVDWLLHTGGLTNQQLNTGGLRIVTTLDKDLQNSGQESIWTKSGLNPAKSHGYILAMPSVNPKDGSVTSMITDLHYGVKKGDPGYSEGRVFTDAYAGSGSTYKYFTALTALKSGVPPSFQLTTPNNAWQVKNCPQKDYIAHNAGNYAATLPLSSALPESSNTYFVAMEDQLFGCNLSPIVDTATGLGMNYLKNTQELDSSGKPIGESVAQAIKNDNRPTFTLGQEPTSALELTGAFSALANDGVFCPPTPVKSISDPVGNNVPFKHVGCSRQYNQYVARTLVNIMTADTAGNGTANGYFGNWYGQGGSLVAAKTGTNNATTCSNGTCTDNGQNSALWFVGITPTLTSAAALVNPQSPNQTIANVPGVTANNNGTDTFGAYAANFWLDAYQPALLHQPWTWPTVDQLPGDTIPQYSVVNQSTDTATAFLTSLGYKVSVLPYFCGSNIQAGNVAFFGPAKAVPGDTISLCRSSGAAPYVYTPPVVAPPKPSHGGGDGGGTTSGGVPTPGRTKHPR